MVDHVKLEPGGAGTRHANYFRMFSMPFSRQQYNELLEYYFAEHAVAQLTRTTRSGTVRQSERQIKPWTMISRAPQGVQGELSKLTDAGEHEKALKIMRALRYFEKYPRAFGGPAPPWHSCLVESGEIIDVSMDVIDVEAVIFEVLLMKVVKPEPGLPSGATSVPHAAVKLEKSSDDPEPDELILGTKVRRQFPGYGWYDGEVISSEVSAAGKVQVHWHDGTTTLMTTPDVKKFATQQREPADIRSQTEPDLRGAKYAKPASAVAHAASLRHLPHTAYMTIASFSPPPTVYSMCLTSACFHQPVENATGKRGDHVLLATSLLRASLLSSMSCTLLANSAKKEFDAEAVQGRGLSLAALQALRGTKGSSVPEFLISGSIVLQAVLGVDYGSEEYEAGSDIDLFCTPKAAAAARSMLVECGYMLSGFPEGYSDNGNGSTAALLESNVHHVESYCPVNDYTLYNGGRLLGEDGAYEEACRNGRFLRDKWEPPDIQWHMIRPEAFIPTKHHTVECLPGQELPYNFHSQESKVIDLVVAEADCKDARGLLKSFDIVICKCSFDGQTFRIPDPHLTFTKQTRLEPTRMDLMLAYCKAAAARAAAGGGGFVDVCSLEDNGAFTKAGIDPDICSFCDEGEGPMWCLNFFHRLFSRHKKYAKRGIRFVDRKAHAKFMKTETELLELDRAGDIGHFGEHEGVPGAQFFMNTNSSSSPSKADACSLISSLGADPTAAVMSALKNSTFPHNLLVLAHQARFQVIRENTKSGLSVGLCSQSRAALVSLLDAEHAAGGGLESDYKAMLSRKRLEGLVGAEAVARLLSKFAPDFFSSPGNVIKLRRCEAHGQCLNPHLDRASRTMQVALNGQEEYEGGRLVFVTRDGFQCPARPAGTITIHDRSVVHGVTKMRTGVRYGLFFLVNVNAAAPPPASITAPPSQRCSLSPVIPIREHEHGGRVRKWQQ
jgi:hypothetical protein